MGTKGYKWVPVGTSKFPLVPVCASGASGYQWVPVGASAAGPSESGSEKFEKWKVKKRSFHSFSRSAKWKKYAFTLFREVQSEKKCFHSFSRSEKWNQNASRPRSRSENSREFLTILEKRDFTTELFDKEEEVADFQDDFTHLALASTTHGGLTTWRRTSTRLSTRTLMTWRANLRRSRSSFLCWYPRQ